MSVLLLNSGVQGSGQGQRREGRQGVVEMGGDAMKNNCHGRQMKGVRNTGDWEEGGAV